MKRKPTISLIIATYNAPQMLRQCLLSVGRQKVLPDEVIIADDGSTEETHALIEQMSQRMGMPLRHVWHEDMGFRLAAIRNRAIAESCGEYIIQIDGDIILDSHFVADHLRFAQEGHVVLGSRCMLTEERTREVLSRDEFIPSQWQKGIVRRDSALRCPWLSPLFFRSRHTIGCNMAFWRKDVLAVNGYDERFKGWGHEERDLVLRLTMIGVKKRKLKYAAIQYHLWHRERSRDHERMNEQIVLCREASGCHWAEMGILKNGNSN